MLFNRDSDSIRRNVQLQESLLEGRRNHFEKFDAQPWHSLKPHINDYHDAHEAHEQDPSEKTAGRMDAARDKLWSEAKKLGEAGLGPVPPRTMGHMPHTHGKVSAMLKPRVDPRKAKTDDEGEEHAAKHARLLSHWCGSRPVHPDADDYEIPATTEHGGYHSFQGLVHHHTGHELYPWGEEYAPKTRTHIFPTHSHDRTDKPQNPDVAEASAHFDFLASGKPRGS